LDLFHCRFLYHRIVTEPLEPQVPEPHSEARESPLVLIPVAAEDVSRQKRRRVYAWTAAIVVALAVAAWVYKRSTDPLRAQESFDAAQRLFAVAEYNQAIVACDRAIALKPDFEDAYMLRGRSHVAQYDPERAIPDFTKAIGIQPQDPRAPLERAHAYIDQKNFAAALSDAASALALDPKLARAHNLRATALRALGDPQKAIEEFTLAANLEPSSDNFYQRGATYQIVGDHEHAILDFTEAISFNPEKPQAYFARAESERAVGEMKQAEDDHEHGRYLDGR
jgi:tetratricopeptide (TPR) repeat protein